jgi:excisionase family DNA binding protein
MPPTRRKRMPKRGRNCPPELPRFYSPRQVADILSVGPTTVIRYTHDGILKSIRIGKLIRIPAADVERLIKEAS